MKHLRPAIDLRTALILLVLTPLLTVFGLGGFVVLSQLEQHLEERLQEDISLIARTLRVPLARALERDRQGAVERTLTSTFEFGRVYGVYVYDSDGELIAKADRLDEPDESAIEQLDIERAEGAGEYQSMGGRKVYSYFAPLVDAGGQVIGMLQVTRRASEIRDYLEALRLNVLLLILVFGLAFMAIVIAGHHLAIGRPLGRLSRAMAEVAGGNTDVRADMSGPREIRELGRRFNAMLDGIAERDSALASERERQSRLKDRLRQSEKYALVGRLAAGVAHELGTPLSVVDGHAQRLMRGKSPDSPEHNTLLQIRDAAARMSAIVQQLLGFGQRSAREPEPVPVTRLVSLASADVRGLYDNSGTELEIVSGSAESKVRVDEARLRDALVHLLKNAQHAAAGGRVRIGWETDRNAIVIFVEDSGPGIGDDDAARIFEPFFTTKRPGEGSGLGLAIVKGIAVDYGAEVSVFKSSLGGAGFRMEFPLKWQVPDDTA